MLTRTERESPLQEDRMERTVPATVGEGIELYIRTYYSLLRSSGDIRVRSLEETHQGMLSSLHLAADAPEFDASAFLYSVLRLPDCLHRVRRIYLGQSEEVFMRGGLTEVTSWQRVDATARRRRMLFDGRETLAAFVSSVSDIDDLVPSLTAYQIEWNKLHNRLAGTQIGQDLAGGRTLASNAGDSLLEALGISPEDFAWLQQAWRADWDGHVQALADRLMDLRINSLASGFNNYRKAAQGWWDDLVRTADPTYLEFRPVYFVSSNPHSLPNLLCGYVRQQEPALIDFIKEQNPDGVREEWERLAAGDSAEARQNLLYYVLRSYLKRDRSRQTAVHEMEAQQGVFRFDDPHSLDISAQIIDLQKLDPTAFDARLRVSGIELLRQSKALIVNVDYPLGFAAYLLLSQIASSISDLLGVYVMGKAATLNARVGDVMLPNVVYDEHSRNTFLYKNCFLAQHVAPYLLYGDVFDNQKTVTVRGTFLQNREFMGVFYREGYTDIEMEAGPYLSAVYEDIYPRRYPYNEIVNLFINAPYDIGVLHYASDTPYSRQHSLLSKSLSYFGVDATYACSIAILRRIFDVEIARIRAQNS
jgi:hypothetical protein